MVRVLIFLTIDFFLWFFNLHVEGTQMRIIIVGAGKIGKAIINTLVKENHDIIVVDILADVVEDIVNTYDVKGVVGNGASYEILMEAEANKAELLIACTPSDELNILSCLVSKKCGVKHTIARVRNPEYSKQMDFFRNELGVSMTVNPELATAEEIHEILKFPGALKVEHFANHRVEIVGLSIPKNSPLIGKRIMDIRKEYNLKMLICIVERDKQAYIPDGSFVLQEDDKIYVNAQKTEINQFFKKIGQLKTKAKQVMIIGGSKISYYLAQKLIDNNVAVKIIELDKERCQILSELLPEVDIIHGEGSDQTLLQAEGIEYVDALVTLTGFDEENIIISLYAKLKNVPKVITKINRYDLTDILRETELDTIVTPKEVTTNIILRYVRSLQNTIDSEVKTLYQLVNNQVEAIEFYIPDSTKYTGIKLKDLAIKPNILVASIIRNNKVIIPSGNDYLQAKDSVIVITTNKQIRDLEDILE